MSKILDNAPFGNKSAKIPFRKPAKQVAPAWRLFRRDIFGGIVALATEVAEYLLYLAGQEEEPEFLSHLRLQKLLYYTQGWALALLDRPLFDDRIEAWQHGPVVPAVWREYKDFGYDPLPTIDADRLPTFSAEDSELIEKVWSAYRPYSATSLRDMTHGELPWIEAREGFSPGQACNAEIKLSTMQTYFKSLAANG